MLSIMSSQTLYLDGEYLAKNPGWHAEESPWKARQILRMLQQNQLAPKTICDVGCGAGEVLRQLQEQLDRECRFWGYEVSPQAFEMCRSRANDRLHFTLGDIRRAKDAFFDLILVLDVIEHLEDYFRFLRAIRPKSGHKIFHIPLDVSAQTVLRPRGLLKRRDLYAHIHYFTKETALRMLEDVGYEVQDYFYTPRMIDLPEDPVQKVLKLPRRVGFSLHRDWTVRILGGFSLLVLAR
jgi:cyclopropane fatty-acyl-phospholipid synthase-like methyltransferase